jgi:hypothetical protein
VSTGHPLCWVGDGAAGASPTPACTGSGNNSEWKRSEHFDDKSRALGSVFIPATK